MNWHLLLNLEALSSLLPQKYDWIVRPVQKGLAFFLSDLPEDIQQKILHIQLRLPSDTPISTRLGLLARQSPVLHKLGQILARDQRLASPLRAELQKLEWIPPTFSAEAIHQSLVNEFGSLTAYNVELASQATAEASVAVVIPFSYRKKYQGGRKKWSGVFKLLKPGIKKRLNLELKLLQEVGAYLEEQCEELKIPKLEYEDTFRQVSEGLQNEVQLDREQNNLREAALTYRNQSQIHIPKLLEPSSPRATAMEWISGTKLSADSITSDTERIRMATLAVRALVASPMFSVNERALFHGDPHAGNLFRTESGKLGLLDWSLADHLSRSQRTTISQLCLAAAGFQPTRMRSLIESLAKAPVLQQRDLDKVVATALSKLRDGRLPSFSWLVELLDEAVLKAKLKLPVELVLFRKALLTLSGQLQELTGNPNYPDTVLLYEFMCHFTAEFPARLIDHINSSDYATHLSNIDLINAVSHFWLHPWKQFMGGGKS